MISSYRRIASSFIMILVLVGTCGYSLLEGWSLPDSFFMTIITMSTVGYGETQELSPHGRLFTSFLISISVVTMACWTASMTGFLVNQDLTGAFKRKKERAMIAKMKGHVIVCGSGVLARTTVLELVNLGHQVVVVTDNVEEAALLNKLCPSVVVLNDDPKSETSLMDANVLGAKYIVSALENDLDNLLNAITGVGLGSSIKVICIANNQELAGRMLKVGADHVVCPSVLGGTQTAQMIDSNSG